MLFGVQMHGLATEWSPSIRGMSASQTENQRHLGRKSV